MTAHFQRGAILIQQGRHSEAIAELHLHLLDSPEDVSAYSLLSFAFSANENYQEAAAHAKKAISLDPDSPKSHYALATSFAAQSKWRDAEDVIREAIRIDPDEPHYLSLLANTQYARYQFDEAIDTCQRGLTIAPDNTSFHRIRDLINIAQGNHNTKTTSSLALEPDDDSSHTLEGLSKLYASDPNSAIAHFREALRIDPNNDLARKGLIESLKSRNPVYLALHACLTRAARLHILIQWLMLTFGILVGEMCLQAVEAAEVSHTILFAGLLMFAFVASAIWLGPPLFNLIIWTDPLGRLALTSRESQGAVALGIGTLLSFCLFVGWLTTQEKLLFACGIRTVFILIAAATFIRTRGKITNRWWLAVSLCMTVQFAMSLIHVGSIFGWISEIVYQAGVSTQIVLVVEAITYLSIVMTVAWPFLFAIPAAIRRVKREQRAAAENSLS